MCIVKGSKASSNMTCLYDRDFSLLFSQLSQKLQEEEHLHCLTEAQFTTENFVKLHQENMQLARKNGNQSKDMHNWNLKCLELVCYDTGLLHPDPPLLPLRFGS